MSSSSSPSSSSTSTSTTLTIDDEKLQQFVGKVLSDFAGAGSCVLAYIGDKLGLYKAMSDFGKPITSQELANLTSTSERYIREWLANQAAAGYLTYDSSSQKYALPIEHAQALVNENSPAYIPGAFQAMMSFYRDEPKILEAFKTGKGVAWGEHDKDLFEGTERFFRPSYTADLVSSWIPALDNGKVEQRLKQEGGLIVADIGCGHGISTILMAKAYPNSKFYGFDNHLPSIEYARNQIRKEEETGGRAIRNVEFFSVHANDESIGNDYDLITFFDCLHDMGDPVGAMKFAKQSLKPDGTCMIIEPMANDKVEENLNVVGRTFYAASTLVCVPNSLADNGPALGAQAGEKRIKDIVEAAGFTKFRRSTQTPFNIIYEAK